MTTNRIKVKPAVVPVRIRSQIQDAFRRIAELEARRIGVDVEGDKVILRGYVGSWSEKEDAERVAWSAPGVSAVENHLIVVQSTPTWMRVVCLLLVVALLVVTLMWPALAYLNTRQQQSPNGPPRIWIQAPETEQP